jgi:hypothetical protein
MMHLLASYDPKAERWVGKVEETPIRAEAVRLDDLLTQVWTAIRDLTNDQVEEFRLIVHVGKHERGLLETLHLERSPANAKRLDESIADAKAGKVSEFRP